MLIENTLFGEVDKVKIAIETLKRFCPEDGYYVAFSGGKDSVVIKALCDMAEVKYDAHYRITSVDPPELVRFIKENYKDVSLDFPRYSDGTVATMWNLIPKKKIPPTRLARYCCAVLKEDGGDGRMTVTGVRWAESTNRKKNQGKVTIYKKNGLGGLQDNPNFQKTDRGGVVLVNDNEESRRTIESCFRRQKTVLNPIIDWEDEDVWEFIHKFNIPYCHLYDEGYKRLGCIGCPMSTAAAAELDKYPKYKANYLKAFRRMLDRYTEPTSWKDEEEVMNWWLGKKTDTILEGQIDFEELMNTEI